MGQEALLNIAIDTLISLNQTCAATSQNVVEIVQESGDGCESHVWEEKDGTRPCQNGTPVGDAHEYSSDHAAAIACAATDSCVGISCSCGNDDDCQQKTCTLLSNFGESPANGAETVTGSCNARVPVADVGAQISNININQTASASADCIMIASAGVDPSLMSTAIRERFVNGVLNAMRQSQEDVDTKMISEYAAKLSAESFSRCLSQSNNEKHVRQLGGCKQIIRNVNVDQVDEAIVRNCLLIDLASTEGGGGETGPDGDSDAEEEECEDKWYYIVAIGVVVFLILVMGFVLIGEPGGSESSDAPQVIVINVPGGASGSD